MNTTIAKQDSTQPSTANRMEYRSPRYEVHNLDDAYRVDVYVPGVKKDNTRITLDKDTLTITHRVGSGSGKLGIHPTASMTEWTSTSASPECGCRSRKDIREDRRWLAIHHPSDRRKGKAKQSRSTD